MEFDEMMIAKDLETNQNESVNQAPSPSSSLPTSRTTYPGMNDDRMKHT
jgi:hypothetical protein